MKKTRAALPALPPEPAHLAADPFYVLGQLKQVLNGTLITGLSRSPTQRLREARAILARWEDAKAASRSAPFFPLGDR